MKTKGRGMTPLEAFRRTLLPLVAAIAFYAALISLGTLSVYWMLIPPWPPLGRSVSAYATLAIVFAAMIVLFRVLPAYRALSTLSSSAVNLNEDVKTGAFVPRVLGDHYVRVRKRVKGDTRSG